MNRSELPISVIIPTYNRRELLERAIRSVLSQTLPPSEIIVVDDGSTDATHELANQFPMIRWIFQTNQGVSAARNAGAKLANYPWLAFLDSDDAWLPRKLSIQYQILTQEQGILAVHANEIWIRHGRRVNAGKHHRLYSGYFFPYSLPRCLISPSGILINHDLFDRLGGFDESLPACEDYDLWLRLCTQQPVILPQQPLVIKYGGHHDQLSRLIPALDYYRIRALTKWLDETKGFTAYRVLALITKAEKSRILAEGAKTHDPSQLEQLEHSYHAALNEAKDLWSRVRPLIIH